MKISIQPPASPVRQGVESNAPDALIEKPPIARLQESDVMRTLSGILTTGGIPDVTRMGWPTLRAGFPLTTFLNAMREMRATLAKVSRADLVPVMAVIGAGSSEDRAIAALNVALAAARDGSKVLMIDADHAAHTFSNKVNGLGKNGSGKRESGYLGWLSIGTKAFRAIKTANGISILPARSREPTPNPAMPSARRSHRHPFPAGGYDLVILEGPALPWSAADRKLLDGADGLVAILPARLDINDCMEDIIAALGGAERKLIGVVLNELNPAAIRRQRDKQYA